MSEKLPGAEYAPIVDIQLPAPFLEEQAAAWRTSLSSIDKSWEDLHRKTLTRRLSCTDPDDQRAIWRRAAIHLGYDEEAASTAVLSLRQMPEYEEVVDWMLVVHAGLCDEEYLWSPHGDLDPPESREEATAALCAHVWGPK